MRRIAAIVNRTGTDDGGRAPLLARRGPRSPLFCGAAHLIAIHGACERGLVLSCLYVERHLIPAEAALEWS